MSVRAALFKHHASSYSDENPSPLEISDPTKDMIETHPRMLKWELDTHVTICHVQDRVQRGNSYFDSRYLLFMSRAFFIKGVVAKWLMRLTRNQFPSGA
jgi:hypothetical protein